MYASLRYDSYLAKRIRCARVPGVRKSFARRQALSIRAVKRVFLGNGQRHSIVDKKRIPTWHSHELSTQNALKMMRTYTGVE